MASVRYLAKSSGLGRFGTHGNAGLPCFDTIDGLTSEAVVKAMKSYLTPLTLSLIGLLLAWSVASWFMASASQQRFDLALETIANGRAKDFFELEVLEYREGLYGAVAELKVLPTSALLDEDIEDWKFFLQRINGPIFINRNGVQMGLARWQLSVEAIDSEVLDESLMPLSGLFSSPLPIASLRIGLFENTYLIFESPVKSLGNWLVDSLVIEGDIDFVNAQHQIQVNVSGLKYRDKRIAVSIPEVHLLSKSVRESTVAGSTATNLTLEANNGELVLPIQSKKIPFNLQSHGSVWLNNDTLSSDWQVAAFINDKSSVSGSDVAGKSDALKADVDLQLREFLVSGFWQYLNNQSEIFRLLQQAEWAVEEVETPEQQDFLRSLFLDADRIKKSQLDNPLKPLLLAKRSQLAINARLSTGGEGAASELSLGGNTISRANEPELALKGEARIQREMLNKRWLAVLDGWNKRQWFRRYETEFESDITVRNGRLLLNNLIMSVDRLSAELSQALTDQ